jgi:hypothetical protein
VRVQGTLVLDDVAGMLAEAIAFRHRSGAWCDPRLLRLRVELVAADERYRAVEAISARGVDGWLTCAEAAKRHGISPRAVRARCAAGSLTARKGIDGRWRIQQ